MLNHCGLKVIITMEGLLHRAKRRPLRDTLVRYMFLWFVS
jgi:hypothetical protein